MHADGRRQPTRIVPGARGRRRSTRFTLCVESWFDDDVFGSATTTQSVRAQQSGQGPAGVDLRGRRRPERPGSDARIGSIRADPTSTERVPNRNRVEFVGLGPARSIFDRDPGIQVRYVHEIWGTATPWATVTPRAGSAPVSGAGALVRAERASAGRTSSRVGDSSDTDGGGDHVRQQRSALLRRAPARSAAARRRHLDGAGRRRARGWHQRAGGLERAGLGPLAREHDVLGDLRPQPARSADRPHHDRAAAHDIRHDDRGQRP